MSFRAGAFDAAEEEALNLLALAARAYAERDYELTDLGRSLQAPIDALRTWIHTHSAQILAHRESYDAVES